jgi:hypothetical protein
VSNVMVGFTLSSLLWVLFSFLFLFSSVEHFIYGLLVVEVYLLFGFLLLGFSGVSDFSPSLS